MATIEIVVSGSQSNAFHTTDRVAPADIASQPVPAWWSMILNPGDGRLKTTPWHSLQTNRETFPFGGSRVWCGIPEWCVKRLRDLGHAPRLIKCAVGASTYDSDWPNVYSALMRHYVTQARASAGYPGPADLTVIVTIHGESDVAAFSATYGARIPGVISAIRTPLGATTHVVLCQLNSGYLGGSANVNTIRAAQAAWVAGDAHATLFDLSAFTLGADLVHYAGGDPTSAPAAGAALGDTIAGLLP